MPSRAQPTLRRGGSRHRRWTYLLLLGLCCGIGRASEDEAVLQALQQRARAAQGQNNALLMARWTWTFRHYGLPIPPLGGYYDYVVHRPDTILDRPAATRPSQVHQQADPIPVVQGWTRIWNDVEDPHRDSVAVFLEIIWTGPRTVDFALTIPWLTARTTTIRVLEQAGLHTACTTSHRCDLYHNGELKFGVGLSLAHGHFIQIEGFPTSPPGSSSEEDSPVPISGVRSPSTSTSSTDTTSGEESTSESSGDAAPEEYTQLIHIYRPRVGLGRPSHVPALIPPGSRTWRTSVFAAWPSLRYQPWHHADVHRTFYLDYPQGDDVLFKVVVVPTDLPTALHQVLLVVLHWQRHVLYQAVALPPQAVPGHLLAALDLLPWCGPLQQFCATARNGHPWSHASTLPVFHGDYARIRISDAADSALGTHLAQVFNLEDEVSNWHSIDVIGIARLRGDTSEAAAYSPGLFPTPGSRAHFLHGDWYWIAMGTLMSFGTFALLYQLCPVEARYPLPARHIAGKRRPCLRQHPQVIGLKTYLVTYLLLSQAPVSTGLQLPAFAPFADFTQAEFDPTPGFVAGPAFRPYLAEVFDRLPPPGNPLASDDSRGIINRDSLTTKGHLMCAFLSTYCNIQNLVEKTRCSFTSRPTTSNFVSRPIPTPARSQRIPIALSDHLDFSFVGRTRTSNGASLPTGESSVPEPVTQVHTPPVFDISDPISEQTGPITFSCPLTCTDRTLNDLFTPWPCGPCPSPTCNEDIPACLRAILQRPHLLLEDAEAVMIYTDGSHSNQSDSDGRHTTWAFVILGTIREEWRIIDWYGDFVDIDPLSAQWWGAQHDTIQEGETSALLGASLWILQMEREIDAPIFSDSKTALNMTLGHYTRRVEDDLTLRARATYQLLQTLAYRTTRYRIAHVRAHRGDVGNELADYVARSIREGNRPPRPVPRHYAQWFHGHPPMILQASFVMDFAVRPQSLPSFDGSNVTFTPGERPLKPPDWLPQLPTPNAQAALPAAHLIFSSYNVHTLRRKGRVAFLREQFTQKRVFLAGLQETRTPDSSTFDSAFLRFCAPAEKGQGGTELWLSTTIPFAFEGQTPRYVQRHCVQILHAEAELLLAEVDLGQRPFLCLVGHGPHKGYPADEIRQWWSNAGTLVQRFRKSRPVLALVDANAAVAAADPMFGALDEQEWDVAGESMRDFCDLLGLHAPSTFERWHFGSSTTWTSSKAGTHGTRNDYILVDNAWMSLCTGSWTDDYVDSGHQMLDHSAVMLSLTWAAPFHCPKKRSKTYDRQKILQASPEQWQRFFEGCPDIPWSTDVTEHAGIVEGFLHRRLCEFFPREVRRKRDSVFSEPTWKVYQAKGQSKRELTRCRRTVDLWTCAWAWEQWSNRHPLRAQLRVVTTMVRACARLHQYRCCSQDLRQRLQQDRADYVESLLQPLQSSPGKSAVKLLRPLRLGKRHRNMGLKALPIARDEHGQVVASRLEALERWRRHFGQMEGGQPTTPEELWQEHQDQLDRRPSIQLNTSDLPTLQELEMQLRRAPLGKSCGIDNIPGELLHSACPQLATFLWPLLLKVASRLEEPLQWKGGQLVALHKGKNSPMECSSYRAILVSSALGKSMHGVFRERTIPYLQRAATPLQFSIHPHGMVGMAAHCIRLAQGKAKHRGLSDYTIFVDIASAYYTLLRQHCVDLSWHDEDIICLLRRLGIEDTHIESVAAMLSSAPAFSQLGVPEPLHALVAEFHSATWFTLAADWRLTSTHRGTRPGDGFADVLWSAAFSQFLHNVETKIRAANYTCPLQWNEERGLHTAEGDTQVHGACVTWADDIACFGQTSSADHLVPALQTTSSILFSSLTALGLKPNMGRGKTEVIATPRGRNKTPVRQFIHHALHSSIPIPDQGDQEVALRVVAHYPHLGGQISHCGRMRGELRRRLAIASQSVKDLSTKFTTTPRSASLHV